MSKEKEEDLSVTVLRYLKTQNRPYSVNDLVANLHKENSKTQIQKAVDNLVVDGKVKEKIYGKAKVYWIDQGQFGAQDPAALASTEARIGELTREIKANEEVLRKAEGELRILKASLSTKEAKEQLAEMNKERIQLEKKLAEISGNRVQVSAGDFKKVEQVKTKHVSEWRKRKRMCSDMLEAILEGYPKTKKALLEDIGIEADEDVGAKMPA